MSNSSTSPLTQFLLGLFHTPPTTFSTKHNYLTTSTKITFYIYLVIQRIFHQTVSQIPTVNYQPTKHCPKIIYKIINQLFTNCVRGPLLENLLPAHQSHTPQGAGAPEFVLCVGFAHQPAVRGGCVSALM